MPQELPPAFRLPKCRKRRHQFGLPSAGEHQAPFSENTATARTREPQARSLASAELLSPAHPRLLRMAVNMPVRRRTAELSLQTINSHGCVVHWHVRCQYNAAMDQYLLHMANCQLRSAFDRKDQDLSCDRANVTSSAAQANQQPLPLLRFARACRTFSPMPNWFILSLLRCQTA